MHYKTRHRAAVLIVIDSMVESKRTADIGERSTQRRPLPYLVQRAIAGIIRILLGRLRIVGATDGFVAEGMTLAWIRAIIYASIASISFRRPMGEVRLLRRLSRDPCGVRNTLVRTIWTEM